jgi:hypothetical protein
MIPDRQIILFAQDIPGASREFYTDPRGTFLSGYAPVRDRNGRTVAVPGVDMTEDAVPAFENKGLVPYPWVNVSRDNDP